MIEAHKKIIIESSREQLETALIDIVNTHLVATRPHSGIRGALDTFALIYPYVDVKKIRALSHEDLATALISLFEMYIDRKPEHIDDVSPATMRAVGNHLDLLTNQQRCLLPSIPTEKATFYVQDDEDAIEGNIEARRDRAERDHEI